MLKTISAKNVHYTVDGKNILQGVSFKCTQNERLCIFGENGAGKSTLLKIVCGEILPDDGSVERQGHIRFIYVPQEFGRKYEENTIEEYIKENAGESLYKKVFLNGTKLGFDLEKHKDKYCGSLSGGQQKILALSVAFACAPDFILLDEPENHLDIVSRKELVDLMSNFRGGIIFISHDRLVIDATATKIAELAQGLMTITEGVYEDYIDMKMKNLGGRQRAYDAESKRIKQLSKSVVILQQKAIRGKDIAGYRKAKAELEELKAKHRQSGRPEEGQTKIKISTTNQALHSGKLLWRMTDGAYKYDDVPAYIFDKTDLEIRAGNKVVLLGRNGAGKSTFLKCVTGGLELKKGEAGWGNEVSWSYFDQHASFSLSATAIEVVMHELRCGESQAQAALGAMKLDSLRMKIPSGQLSGGERMRIRFAIAFGKKPDLIILDEPTNHIDEITWEILLTACRETKSAILLVTHDYEFIQEFEPSFFWMFKNHKIVTRHKEIDVLLEEMR